LVIGVMTLIVSVSAGLVVSLGGNSQPNAKAASSSVWIQTMDSCKNSIGGATYEVAGAGITVTTPASSPSPVVTGPTQPACPLEQGNCTSATRGCVSFATPAPGTYTIYETGEPPANATNPQGYAPCEGGSACQSETASLTVGSGGGVQAVVTSVYPDGYTTKNSFSGTASNPIVFHDFGLGTGSCDGDNDADDHLTGTPSSHCAYPESKEATACQPYPWSCVGPSTTGTTGTTESSNQHFVNAAYKALLGHTADSGGLGYWTGLPNAGSTPWRSAVAMALATSPAYRTDVIGGNVATGVQDFYELYLHRPGDQPGIDYWVNRMAGIGGPKLTFEQVRLQFIGSSEFFTRTNNNSPAQAITALYEEVLGRPSSPSPQSADPAGFNYWLTHFDVNTIASQFLYSAEGRQYLVEGYYKSILGRQGDSGGVQYWTQQLLNGASDEDIIASIMSSDEFYSDAQSVN
jgi:hypothetical protein